MWSSSVDDTDDVDAVYLKTWFSLASLTKRACRTFHCPPPSTQTWEIGDTCGADGCDPDCSVMTAVSTAVSAAI